MRALAMTLAAVLGFGLWSQPATLQQKFAIQKGGQDEFGPYEVVPNWPEKFVTRPGYIWGSQGGVFAESPNRIFLLNKGELKLPTDKKLPASFNGAWGSLFGLGLGNANMPLHSDGTGARPTPEEMNNCIVIVDGSGKVIERWTQWDRLFKGGRGPHTITISPYDPERAVWVVDDLKEQVYKFSNDGKKLLMILGDGGGGPGKEPVEGKLGVEASDQTHFGRPTNVGFLPEGTFYVTDGYVNTRVVKFDKTGKYLMEFGTKGTGPGQFSQLVHSIAIDTNRRLYIADRANSRIQVFDENGKFIEEWPNIASPSFIMMSADQHLWVADLETNRLLKYDLNGRFEYGWGSYGTEPGRFYGIHEFSVDSDMNFYAAETFGGRTQKFRVKPGADPTHVIMPPLPLMPMSGTR